MRTFGSAPICDLACIRIVVNDMIGRAVWTIMLLADRLDGPHGYLMHAFIA